MSQVDAPEEELQILIELAQTGKPFFQYNLGACYYHGRCAPSNRSEAIRWLKLAAGQGHQAAKGLLGLAYLDDPGTLAEGLQHITEAAEGGISSAQFQLAQFCIEGKGVRQDTDLGFGWMMLSSNNGNSKAQAFLEEYTEKNGDIASLNRMFGAERKARELIKKLRAQGRDPFPPKKANENANGARNKKKAETSAGRVREPSLKERFR